MKAKAKTRALRSAYGGPTRWLLFYYVRHWGFWAGLGLWKVGRR